MTETAFFARLENRGLITVSGADRAAFLQGLITQDIAALEAMPMIYACLLTPQGRFQYDFFISAHGAQLWLDCEGGARAESLVKLLGMYRLRAEVKLEVIPIFEVFGVMGAGAYALPDPRHKDMGGRSYTRPTGMAERDFAAWDAARIRLCVPDGSRDMIVGQSTMLESRIDTLNGVSFTKGCYMGQELTARTHYRGLVKKHLYTVEADSLPDSGAEIKIDGRIIGEMRSSCGGIGLALLKDEDIDSLTRINYRLIYASHKSQ